MLKIILCTFQRNKRTEINKKFIIVSLLSLYRSALKILNPQMIKRKTQKNTRKITQKVKIVRQENSSSFKLYLPINRIITYKKNIIFTIKN